MFKKIMVMITAVGMLLLVGCGKKEKPPIEGDEYVYAAMQDYVNLDSGKLTITDDEKDEVVSEFTFLYNGKVCTYVLNGTFGNKDYVEYNNGKKMWVNDGKSEKTYTYSRYSPYFKKYTRKKPNPNASTGIFFFEPDFVAEVKTIDTEEGKTILYTYDINTLGDKMGLNTEMTSLELYETEFVFDKDNKFVELIEKSRVKNGEETIVSDFSIKVSNKNEITEIPNPLA